MSVPLTVWQVLGATRNRSYADVFIRYGVALIGPGDTGPWSEERYKHDYSLQGFVKRFAEEANTGDAILLRSGMSKVCAVGLIAGDYCYLNQFDDVNGWDLQHCRRVRWCKLPEEYDFGPGVSLGGTSRFTMITDEAAIDYVRRFLSSPPTDWQTARLPDLPEEEADLDELPPELTGVIGEARDYTMLAETGMGFGAEPAEHETVAHFVVPLLRCLGWPPELIAVEWRSVDVAVFNRLSRSPENCVLIVEAKRLGAGVEGALEQALGYVEKHGLNCKVVVTDGIRYRLFDAQGRHMGYANLVRLKMSATKLFSEMRRPRGEH